MVEDKSKMEVAQFFLQDIDYNKNRIHGTEVRMFGLTRDGEEIVVLDRTFDPYFYVIPKEKINLAYLSSKLSSLEVKDGDDIIKVRYVKRKKMKENNNKIFVLKVFTYHPDDIRFLSGIIREWSDVDDLREARIPFIQKYLLNKSIIPYTLCKAYGKHVFSSEFRVNRVFEAIRLTQVSLDILPNPRVLAFDIKTTGSQGTPNLNKDAIVYLSFYGSNDFIKIITWKRFKDAPNYTHFVSGELELIEEFKRTLLNFKPDILVGYDSDMFSLPLIKHKSANQYKVEMNIGWDRSGINTETRNYQTCERIVGYNHLDLLKFIKRIMSVSIDTEGFSLREIARELLGEKRESEVTPMKLTELWEIGLSEDLAHQSECSLKDAHIIFKLAEKILPIQIEFVKLIGQPLFDINRISFGQAVELFLIKNFFDMKTLIPKKPTYINIKYRKKESFRGGFVVKPSPGLYKNVYNFDFRSLYPSIIVAHNIDHSTLNCRCCQGNKINVNGDVFHFCRKKQGIIPRLLDALIDRRNRIKSIIERTQRGTNSYIELSARSQIIKILTNSFYGYLGFPSGRWYSIECAKSVTGFSREYIKKVICKAESFSYNVIYGDTDSIFLDIGNQGKGSINKFKDEINISLPHPIRLEFGGLYLAGIFFSKKGETGGAKKRYALLKKDDSLVLKGVEAIRGDWSAIAKKAQINVLKILLKGGSLDEASQYLSNLLSDVRSRRVNIDDLAINVTLTKHPYMYKVRVPHVAAADLAQKKGYKVGPGFTVSYIIGSGFGKISDRVILTEDARLDNYDIDYYIDNQIMRATYQLFEVFDDDENAQATLKKSY